jgi:hypothetical protein
MDRERLRQLQRHERPRHHKHECSYNGDCELRDGLVRSSGKWSVFVFDHVGEETGNVFDNSGAGYLIGHRSAGKVVFVFTDSKRVQQSGGNAGELLFTPDYSNAVVVAGPLANPTTAFYEGNGFTPLTFSLSGGNAIFKQSGTQVFSVPFASLTSTNDYFIMEPFQDAGHTVIVLYGINAPGTLASGVYFDSFVFTNLANYPAGAYIVHWQGKVPNTPLASDTYTIVYHT